MHPITTSGQENQRNLSHSLPEVIQNFLKTKSKVDVKACSVKKKKKSSEAQQNTSNERWKRHRPI